MTVSPNDRRSVTDWISANFSVTDNRLFERDVYFVPSLVENDTMNFFIPDVSIGMLAWIEFIDFSDKIHLYLEENGFEKGEFSVENPPRRGTIRKVYFITNEAKTMAKLHGFIK